MPSTTTLVGFVLIVALFAAVPGPSNLYVVACGLRTGRLAALAAAAGCALGASVYVVATSVGLAALLASSSAALSVLHYVGGAYLVWLGIRALRASGRSGDVDASNHQPERKVRALGQGFLAELTNPKVALFFLAFFPQFVQPSRGPAWSQILVLGAVFCITGLISDSAYAIASGAMRARLAGRSRWRVRSERASAVLYLGLGAWAFASGTQTEAR